jgi:hypothetical protein
MKITFWECPFSDYDEIYDPDTNEEWEIYMCKNPRNSYGACDVWDDGDCDLLDENSVKFIKEN